MNSTSSLEKYNLEKHPNEKKSFETVYDNMVLSEKNDNRNEMFYKEDEPRRYFPVWKEDLEKLREQNRSNSYFRAKKSNQTKKSLPKKNTPSKSPSFNSLLSSVKKTRANPKHPKKRMKETRRILKKRPAWKPTGKALKIRLG